MKITSMMMGPETANLAVSWNQSYDAVNDSSIAVYHGFVSDDETTISNANSIRVFHQERIDGLTMRGESPDNVNHNPRITLSDFQQLIRDMYYEKDRIRGVEGTFMWLMEEVGELSSALRQSDKENLGAEFADVLAWLATIANVAEIDLSQEIAKKYGNGCPGCGRLACVCPDGEKP